MAGAWLRLQDSSRECLRENDGLQEIGAVAYNTHVAAAGKETYAYRRPE